MSDTRTPETDTSGRAIAALLEQAGHTVVGRRILRDEPAGVTALLRELLELDDVQAIVSTGGTGISRRDSTYEAVARLFEKELPGFGELFRMLSFQEIGPAAMLSRATAGLAAGRIIVLLPGSEHAVRLGMERLVLPELGHLVSEARR